MSDYFDSFIKIYEMADLHDVVYVAYQSDVNDYMAVDVTEEPKEADGDFDYISVKIIGAMQACLVGWWAKNASLMNKQIAEMANWKGSFIADRSGFVVRVTKNGWRAFEVEFVSDRLDETIVKEIKAIGECPIPLPTFFTGVMTRDQQPPTI